MVGMMNNGESEIKIAIIGGTGFENGDIFEKECELDIDTPFGKTSDKIKCGKINGVNVVFLSRHARDHSIMPSKINYKANIYAIKKLNCTHIVTTNACGSLDGKYCQGDIVIPDQLYDNTKTRSSTFYDGTSEEFPSVYHSPCPDPFNKDLRQILINSLEETNITYHPNGAIVVIEGPRFSTRFESRFYQSIGCKIIGMTSSPEAFLAYEIGLPYATVALVTDMDSWNEDVEHVTGDNVSKVFAQFVGDKSVFGFQFFMV